MIVKSPPPEIEDVEATLSGRSVPHRFFRSDTGDAVDDLASIRGSEGTQNEGIQSEVTQEGVNFFYLDPQGKLEAQNGQFNMNSILGQISVDLSQAHPAQVVPIEFDRVYMISTTSGSYLPCSSAVFCPPDQWLEQFSAHPAIYGVDGLTAIGHSTRRDHYQENYSRGNFEDTKFGRACWIPPSMIPFSHRGIEGPVQTQRLSRLNTQAAFYINGYQRDWFGFNKGAVIGSFDGVTWFAIGNGRRVHAKSDKLFLAINAPFGDLASRNNFEVFIHEDPDALGVTPDYDFDPEPESSDHPHFNQAASCQQFHQCEVDADCVTQLGWEYTCADIGRWKTLLPSFNLHGEERDNRHLSRSPDSFLIGGLAPESGQKRCIYRGRGAICRQNLALAQTDPRYQKLLACAPNFHCAPLSYPNFNYELARNPNALTNILYGFEADVLGRPLHYLGSIQGPGKTGRLLDPIQDNIRANFTIAFRQEADVIPGLCMPGKDIGQNTYIEQHRAPDPHQYPRTDYISQIGPCNSDIESRDPNQLAARVWSCPLFDPEGNYILTDDSSFNNHRDQFLTQNSCGHSSREPNSGENTFASIEATQLGLVSGLAEKTHAAHGCMRRASSPCFTDLDCTPSRLHAETAGLLGREYFGNTRGEKEYWQEFLTCGQVRPKPFFGTPQFDDYDITQNRCCRPIGEDIGIAGRRDLIDEVIVPTDDPSRPIASELSIFNRTQDRRSSRFMAIYNQLDLGPPPTTCQEERDYSHQTPPPYQDFALITSNPSGVWSEERPLCANRPGCDHPHTFYPGPTGCTDGEYEDRTKDNQWSAPHLMASRTCCGGGWVRKFADGGNDWTRTDRTIIPVENFNCLNYRNEYLFKKPSNVSARNYNADIDLTCREAASSGCPQINFAFSSNGFKITRAPMINDERNYNPANSSDPFSITGFSTRNKNPLVTRANYSSLNFDLSDDDDDDDDSQSDENPYFGAGLLLMLENQAGIFAAGGIRTVNSDEDPWVSKDNTRVTYHLPAYINLFSTASPNNLRVVGVSYFPPPDPDDDDDDDDDDDEEEDPFADFVYLRIGAIGSVLAPNEGSATVGSTTFRAQVTFSSKGHHTLGLSCNPCSDEDFFHAWPVLDFIPQGTTDYRESEGGNSVAADANLSDTTFPFVSNSSSYGMVPGSDTYYLTKLGRLELLGVPQIHYEPLYCNSNMGKLIPGLYTFETREEVEKRDFSDDYNSIIDHDIVDFYTLDLDGVDDPGNSNDDDDPFPNGNKWLAGHDNPNHFVLDKDKVALDDIFSEDEILCCAKLGTLVDISERCCTNHSRDVQGSDLKECALPPKTNLMVYFNRFISGEGRHDPENEPNGLEDDKDFNPKTGEPSMNRRTYNKIRALGQKYCDNNETERTRTGAAFGRYLVEPRPSDGVLISGRTQGNNNPAFFRYGIVDSILDSGIGDKGYEAFSQGYRWNHHLYCKESAR